MLTADTHVSNDNMICKLSFGIEESTENWFQFFPKVAASND